MSEHDSRSKSEAVAKVKRNLDAFLVDNPELEALSARLGQFNLLRVLGAERVEIRHSNVLAWLLTPGESHGLGPHFLRRFLSRLLMDNDGFDLSLAPAQVELMKFDDVEVDREWQNIDIVAHSPSRKWCLLIENKIGSRESAGQLRRYREAVEREFPGYALIPVFLTLEAEDPSEEGQQAGFVAHSYSNVLELAEQITEQNRSRIPSDALVLLRHYFDTLRRLTMQDEELVELCKTIYRKHRQAIDLIIEYGSASQVLDACATKIAQLVENVYVEKTANRLHFLPREMAVLQREVVGGGWEFLPKKYPIMWWYFFGKKFGKLRLAMEVGPCRDHPDLRVALMRALRKAGFSFRDIGLRPEAKFTRILSKHQKLKVTEEGEIDDDPAYIAEVTERLWQKGWEDGSKVLGVLKGFDWDRWIRSNKP